MTRNVDPKDSQPLLPSWNPRVSRQRIWQMYHNDARGNRDEDLVDDVGWTLLLRVESCITVTEAQKGRVKCPKCEKVIQRDLRPRRGEVSMLECGDCGWSLPWEDYRKTFHNKHLECGGLFVPCQEFARDYPRARTYQEKVILIDMLIHRFHWEMEGTPGAPGAAVLIGGTMAEIVDFLNRLTYGDQSTPALVERRQAWRERAKGKPYGLPGDDSAGRNRGQPPISGLLLGRGRPGR